MRRFWPGLVGIGLLAGLISGLFGVGGGVVVVPALVAVTRMPHRRAVGTSLLAILPAAATSVVAYWVAGDVELAAGLLLALGAVAGAPVGSWLLHRLHHAVSQWVFVAMVGFLLIMLALATPVRGAGIAVDPLHAVGLVGLGLGAGVISALLGVGGGAIVIPALMYGFGASDLAAKGASLVMIVPTLLTGFFANLRRDNVDLRAGAVIGFAALPASPVGAWLAHAIAPGLASWLFAGFLVSVAAIMVRQALTRSAEMEVN